MSSRAKELADEIGVSLYHNVVRIEKAMASIESATRAKVEAECAQRTAEAVEKVLVTIEAELKCPHVGDGWVRLLIERLRKETGR
jgi:hypothetical protein